MWQDIVLKVKKMKKKEESLRTLEQLRYQANQYQIAGHGAKSQYLNTKIRRLMEEMNTEIVEN